MWACLHLLTIGVQSIATQVNPISINPSSAYTCDAVTGAHYEQADTGFYQELVQIQFSHGQDPYFGIISIMLKFRNYDTGGITEVIAETISDCETWMTGSLLPITNCVLDPMILDIPGSPPLEILQTYTDDFGKEEKGLIDIIFDISQPYYSGLYQMPIVGLGQGISVMTGPIIGFQALSDASNYGVMNCVRFIVDNDFCTESPKTITDPWTMNSASSLTSPVGVEASTVLTIQNTMSNIWNCDPGVISAIDIEIMVDFAGVDCMVAHTAGTHANGLVTIVDDLLADEVLAKMFTADPALVGWHEVVVFSNNPVLEDPSQTKPTVTFNFEVRPSCDYSPIISTHVGGYHFDAVAGTTANVITIDATEYTHQYAAEYATAYPSTICTISWRFVGDASYGVNVSGNIVTATPVEAAVSGPCSIIGGCYLQAYYSVCQDHETCGPGTSVQFLNEEVTIDISSNACLSVNFSGLVDLNGVVDTLLGTNDPSVPLTYVISASSTTQSQVLDDSLITTDDLANMNCPTTFEFQLLGIPPFTPFAAYDDSTRTFSIDTQDLIYENTLTFIEVQVKYSGATFTFDTSPGQHDFFYLEMLSCTAPVLTDPGQATTTNPVDYYYSGIASFSTNPFVATPSECSVTYSCLMTQGPLLIDLCNYSDSSTTSSFDLSSGLYSMTSIDLLTFGTQLVTFQITATSGSTVSSFSFNLSMKDPCETVVLQVDPTVDDIEYEINDTNQSETYIISSSLVTLTPPTDLCSAVELVILHDDNTPLDNDVFSYDPATEEFTILTTSRDDEGVYDIKIVAQFTSVLYPDQSAEHSFKVTIAEANTSCPSFQEGLSPIQAIIGQDQTVSLPAIEFCLNTHITSIEIKPIRFELPWLTFDEETNSLSMKGEILTRKYSGNNWISVSIVDSDGNRNTFFTTIYVEDDPELPTPIFRQLDLVTVYTGRDYSWSLVYDLLDQDATVIDFDGMDNFLTFNGITFVFKITGDKLTKRFAGKHYLKLEQSEGIDGRPVIFTQVVMIKQREVSVDLSRYDLTQASTQVEQTQKFMLPPTFTSSQISHTGQFEIEFSEDINMPVGIGTWNSGNNGHDVFDLSFIPSQSTLIEFKDQELDPPSIVYWNITSVTPTKIIIQVEFSDPASISTFRNDIDKVDMQILKPELFEGAESNQKLEQDSLSIATQFPPMHVPWYAEIIATILGGSYLAFLGANFACSAVLSTSMQYVWGLVNTLQIIVLTVLLDFKTPVNVQVILVQILQLSNFDIIDTDWLYSKVFAFTQTRAFNQIFSESGYESSNYILLIGLLSLVILLYGVQQLICRPVCKLKKSTETTDKQARVRMQNKTKKLIKIQTFMQECCLELGLTALISLRFASSNTVQLPADYFQVILACLSLPVLLATPLVLLFFTLKIKKLREKSEISLEEDQNLRALQPLFKEYSQRTQFYPIIFFIRRYTLVLLLTMTSNKPKIQAFFFGLLTLIILSQLTKNHPYQSKITNMKEIFNECCVMGVTYILLAYTDWMSSVDFRYSIGWAQITIMVINMLVNFGLMLVITPREALRNFRKIYAVNSFKKLIKEAKLRSKHAQQAGQIDCIPVNRPLRQRVKRPSVHLKQIDEEVKELPSSIREDRQELVSELEIEEEKQQRPLTLKEQLQSSQEIHVKELALYEVELDDLKYDKKQHPQLKANVYELDEVDHFQVLIAEFEKSNEPKEPIRESTPQNSFKMDKCHDEVDQYADFIESQSEFWKGNRQTPSPFTTQMQLVEPRYDNLKVPRSNLQPRNDFASNLYKMSKVQNEFTSIKAMKQRHDVPVIYQQNQENQVRNVGSIRLARNFAFNLQLDK